MFMLHCPIEECKYYLGIDEDVNNMEIVMITNDFEKHLQEHSVRDLVICCKILAMGNLIKAVHEAEKKENK